MQRKRTGIPESTISDWKRKNNTPSADKIMDICNVLQVSPYDLLDGGLETKEIVVDRETDLGVLVDIYRQLGREQQNRVLGYAQGLSDELKRATVDAKFQEELSKEY